MNRTSQLSSLLILSTVLVNFMSCSKDSNSNTTNTGNNTNNNPNNIVYGSYTDPRDGNVYKTVTIGTQVWLAENLKYLPSVYRPINGSENSPYYYVYEYDGTDVGAAKTSSNYKTYGVLYNWLAAKASPPPGWHLPSNDEWSVLSNFLGGNTVSAGKLKEAGTSHWISPNTEGANTVGFSALPGGVSSIYSSSIPSECFEYKGEQGNWWTSSEYNFINGWRRQMTHNYKYMGMDGANKALGFSVRCVKD